MRVAVHADASPRTVGKRGCGALAGYHVTLEGPADHKQNPRAYGIRAEDPQSYEGSVVRIGSSLAPETGEALQDKKGSEIAETELLFASPCSDSIEQQSMPTRARQTDELKLARTAVLICLADMRDACIPEVFVHSVDRRLRRKRVELHMIHVQECRVMQHLKPYMHLFELALVRDLLPHKLHPVAQRLLFSSLDMHARAAESLHFPIYFDTY